MDHLTVSLVHLQTAQVFTAPREGGGTIAALNINNNAITIHLEGADPGSQANELRRLAGTLLAAAIRIEDTAAADARAAQRAARAAEMSA